MARFDLTGAGRLVIAPLLPGAGSKKNGRPRPDGRKVLNGIFFAAAAKSSVRPAASSIVNASWWSASSTN